jgi:GYF domain 2
MDIYLYKSGQQIGPFDITEINKKLDSGEILLTDQAWQPGLIEWKAWRQFLSSQNVLSVTVSC